MAMNALTAENSAKLKTLLGAIATKGTSKAAAPTTPCDVWKKDIEPVINDALPFIKLIPDFGAEIAAALQAIEKVVDQVCA